MDKFFNLMYDFFAFSLPGSFLLLFFYFCNDFGINSVKELFFTKDGSLYVFLIIIAVGYVIGYVITPISRYLLVNCLALSIFGYLVPSVKRRICCGKRNRTSIRRLFRWQRGFMVKKSHSKAFILIREKANNCFHYIQFWDMHVNMAGNLAFVSLVIAIRLCISPFRNMVDRNPLLIIGSVVVFFILLSISYRFCQWWMNDLKEAERFAKKQLKTERH